MFHQIIYCVLSLQLDLIPSPLVLCVSVYFFFFWMLLLVVYSQRDPNAFHLNRHIRDSFTRAVTDSMSLEEVFTWTNTTLLSNLFGVYPGKRVSLTEWSDPVVLLVWCGKQKLFAKTTYYIYSIRQSCGKYKCWVFSFVNAYMTKADFFTHSFSFAYFHAYYCSSTFINYFQHTLLGTEQLVTSCFSNKDFLPHTPQPHKHALGDRFKNLPRQSDVL